ncbi:MAG: hypothetical protein P8168_10070 [Deltaproteobacteria bacterium]
MQDVILSIHGTPIRLTDERWAHITEEHCELAGFRLEVLETVAKPGQVLTGGEGEFLAVRELIPEKHLVVVYRELVNDGFIITAFITSKIKALQRRKQLWP